MTDYFERGQLELFSDEETHRWGGAVGWQHALSPEYKIDIEPQLQLSYEEAVQLGRHLLGEHTLQMAHLAGQLARHEAIYGHKR